MCHSYRNIARDNRSRVRDACSARDKCALVHARNVYNWLNHPVLVRVNGHKCSMYALVIPRKLQAYGLSRAHTDQHYIHLQRARALARAHRPSLHTCVHRAFESVLENRACLKRHFCSHRRGRTIPGQAPTCRDSPSLPLPRPLLSERSGRDALSRAAGPMSPQKSACRVLLCASIHFLLLLHFLRVAEA